MLLSPLANRYNHCGRSPWKKLVSKYLKLTKRIEEGLQGSGSWEGQESGECVLQESLWSPQGMEEKREDQPLKEVWCKAGNEPGKLELENRKDSEDYLPFPWLAWLVGFQAESGWGIDDWHWGMRWRRTLWEISLVPWKWKQSTEKPHQVVCYEARDKTEELELKGGKERDFLFSLTLKVT